MIGGLVTSTILELLIYPVIYMMWRKRQLQTRNSRILDSILQSSHCEERSNVPTRRNVSARRRGNLLHNNLEGSCLGRSSLLFPWPDILKTDLGLCQGFLPERSTPPCRLSLLFGCQMPCTPTRPVPQYFYPGYSQVPSR